MCCLWGWLNLSWISSTVLCVCCFRFTLCKMWPLWLWCWFLLRMGRFDVVTGTSRGSVINTKSFGGQCRTFYSGVHNNFYRLPLSILQYTVTVGLLEAQLNFFLAYGAPFFFFEKREVLSLTESAEGFLWQFPSVKTSDFRHTVFCRLKLLLREHCKNISFVN